MNSNEKFNVFDLEEGHKNLLSKYLTFFKSKQDKFVKEIKLEIEEHQSLNLNEMMFSKQEVTEIIDSLKDKIMSQMDKEISYYVNMNAIFVQLLLHKADELKVTLSVETPQIQNLQNVNEMDEFIKSVTRLPDFGKANVLSKLGSISKTQNLINDHQQLIHDFEMLNQNFGIIKNQNEMLVQENKNLQSNSNNYSDEVKVLRDQLMKLSVNNSSSDNLVNINKMQVDLEATKKNLDDQVSKYQNLLKEYDFKLSESIQFKQLKKFLQEKNSLIVDLKNKLTKYEDNK